MTETSIQRSAKADEAFAVGQQRRRIPQPSAAIRNENGEAAFTATIWYPGVESAQMVSLNIGPADAPYMLGGDVAIDAPFATAAPCPVVLFSHGFHGSAATTSWFGHALASAGYVVISPDHPGGNLEDPQTVGGSLLWAARADDLKAALAAVAEDPVLGPHVDLDRVGVSGFSLGGLTAMIALGGVFDGEAYDAYCIANPEGPLSGPPGSHPIFNLDHPMFSQDVRQELARMSEDHSLPNVRAGFLFAPVAIGLRPESLAAIQVPVSIIVGSNEVVTPPDAGAALAASLIPGATLITVPGATHSSFVNLATPAGVEAKFTNDTVLATVQPLSHEMAVAGARAVFDPLLRPGA